MHLFYVVYLHLLLSKFNQEICIKCRNLKFSLATSYHLGIPSISLDRHWRFTFLFLYVFWMTYDGFIFTFFGFSIISDSRNSNYFCAWIKTCVGNVLDSNMKHSCWYGVFPASNCKPEYCILANSLFQFTNVVRSMLICSDLIKIFLIIYDELDSAPPQKLQPFHTIGLRSKYYKLALKNK